MKLITKEIEKKLPPLGSTGSKKPENVPIIVKFFNPSGAGTWWITEGNLQTGELFGYAKIQEGELGYISLQELQSFRGRMGLGIERDMHYGNHTLKEVMDGIQSAL
jgi:hypothetical protein